MSLNKVSATFSIMNEILDDPKVVQFLLKNENLITKHYNVPAAESPSHFLIKLVNNRFTSDGAVKGNIPRCYYLPSLYSTKLVCCTNCSSDLVVKKVTEATLYDDVLGSFTVDIITKFCKLCKFTYYPGFFEHYEEKSRWYYPEWDTYKIFVSTNNTIFSTDLLNRLISLKQKCHTTFIGKAQSYNLQHGYKEGRCVLDKRRLAEAYYKYTFVQFKERYQLQLNIKGGIDVALKNEFSDLYVKFQQRYCDHLCNKTGCGDVLVIDGHMKAHRKICKATGCSADPKFKSMFCPEHLHPDHRLIQDNEQELLHENEFHVEKIISKRSKKGKSLYEVAWKNHEEHTWEPRENLPRILVEIFERFGDSTLPTTIEENCEINGVKYIDVRVKEEVLILPASSLSVCESAYFVKPFKASTTCNTDKTKSRFYARTGGILVMAKPCGTIVAMSEIICGESVSQVAEVIETFLSIREDHGYKLLMYDDACHLKKHVDCRCVYPRLQNLEMKIDRFHFQNHVDSWCIKNMNPDKSDHAKGVNSEVMEQIFAWVKGFAGSLRYMNSHNYNFFMLDMIDRHNMELCA